jgi:dipeptidyl aminopeptidase/acylaminoacyl peptidase
MKESTQTVGYATWRDPHKWMEHMKGSKWTQLNREYRKEYESAVQEHKELAQEIQRELEGRDSLIPPTSLFDYSYQQIGKQTFLWWFKNKTTTKTACTDLDIGSNGWVWYVKDTDSGDESYTLYGAYNGQHKWTSSVRPFGPFVASVGNRVYSLESENHLWFCRLVSLDAKTGTDRQIHYEETNPQWNLALVKGENHCLCLVANNAGIQRLWYLNVDGLLTEVKGYESFVPVGFAKDSKTFVFFGRKAGRNVYSFSEGHLPLLQSQTPEFACLGEERLVTRRFGTRTLWNLRTGEKLDSLIGQFQPDVLLPWSQGETRFSLSRPGFSMSLYEPTVDCLCRYARSSYLFAKSNDGTSIPYVVVQPHMPTHLLVVGYGAYGLPTQLNTDRWKPLLRRGWAICIAMVRGSGDHTEKWAEDARTRHKLKSIEDFEACIRAAQRKLHLSPRQTAVYGRSAGGYLVGTTVNRHASGDLFGCAYLEVPYLDVLATTANPTLPLTQLESNEFGDPLHKPQNFQALLHLSPVDTIPKGGAPSLFILCRTGLRDKEVFAYESFKWITRLKEAQGSNGKPKLLAAEPNQGHFSGKTSADKLRAQDLSLLIGWASRTFSRGNSKKKYRLGIYQMAPTRRNRKNTASRKNRKNRKNNATMRKNRKNNNAMMGGKRKNRKNNNATMRRRR